MKRTTIAVPAVFAAVSCALADFVGLSTEIMRGDGVNTDMV